MMGNGQVFENKDDLVKDIKMLASQGKSDTQIADALGVKEFNVFQWRKKEGIENGKVIEWERNRKILIDAWECKKDPHDVARALGVTLKNAKQKLAHLMQRGFIENHSLDTSVKVVKKPVMSKKALMIKRIQDSPKNVEKLQNAKKARFEFLQDLSTI